MSWHHHYIFLAIEPTCSNDNFDELSFNKFLKEDDILYLTSRNDYLGKALEEFFEEFDDDFGLDFLTHRYGCFKSWKTNDSKKIFSLSEQQQFIQNIERLFQTVLNSNKQYAQDLQEFITQIPNYDEQPENDNEYSFAFYLQLDLMKRKVQQDINENLVTAFFTYCE